jgi:hypothetical protein
MAIGGQLGFLRVRVQDDPAAPTRLDRAVRSTSRIRSAATIGSPMPNWPAGLDFAQLVDVVVDLDLVADLNLTRSARPARAATSPAPAISTQFPQLQADFHLDWTFDGRE